MAVHAPVPDALVLHLYRERGCALFRLLYTNKDVHGHRTCKRDLLW